MSNATLYLEKVPYLENVDIYAFVRFWTQCKNLVN